MLSKMDFTDDEVQEAKAFGEFYIDKMENHRNALKYYLSEDVVLDWFGQTIKGEKNVVAFLKKTLASVKHILSDAVPTKKIGFRDTHVVKIPKEPKKIPFGLMSPPRIVRQKVETKTPKKQTDASTSTNNLSEKERREIGQGDVFHIAPDLSMSPAKKFKAASGDCIESDLETVEGECESTQKVKYVISEGSVEFHKPSIKKLQTETKWRRPCKLSVAFSSNNYCDYVVYLIIYEGNVKCRRNLMKDFEAEEPEN